MPEEQFNCFVIMPFSKSSEKHTDEYWTNHFNRFLKPLIEEIPRIGAYRVESLHGDILKQIITDLIVSPIVVAELTDHNPNVFWELGVRQSFKHNTITIAEEGTPLPFDVSSKATLFYNPADHLKMEAFRDKFKKALIDCVENPNKADSYVLDAISGRGTLFEIMKLDEAKRRVESLIEEIEFNKDWYNKTCQSLSKVNFLDAMKEQEHVTSRSIILQTQSAEFLLSSRYLEEDKKFYHSLREYLHLILGINNYANNLPSALLLLEAKVVEDIDLSYQFKGKLKKAYNRVFDIMLKHLERIQSNLDKKVSMYSTGIKQNKK